MALHEIETHWMGKMQFNALVNGHTLIMDGPEKVGGENKGPIPKPFLLTALSGCAGMDIVNILRKSRKEVNDLTIHVTGELTTQQPIEYTAIHVVYNFKGDEAYRDAAVNAVNLSQDKYCGVSHMLRKILPLTWEVNYNGVQVFTNKPAVKETVGNKF